MEPIKKRKMENFTDESYFESYADISIHEQMIADKVRTVNYRLAILKNYEHIRGKVVVDVGAGTGILSMFCVQAGAKKVYAIEASSLAQQTVDVIRANNMNDKIQVINKKVEDVELPERVDVIVSEWMGYCLLYENMLPSVIHARDKWLKEGGIMLPTTADVYMVPLNDDEYYKERLGFWDSLMDMYDIDMSCLKPFAKRCLTSKIHVNGLDAESIQSHASKVCHLDLCTVTTEELKTIKGEYEMNCFGRNSIHGFGLWFDVHFPQNITLTTSPYSRETHWMQTMMYFDEPLHVDQGHIISGNITFSPSPGRERYLDIEVDFNIDGKKRTHKKYTMNDFIT